MKNAKEYVISLTKLKRALIKRWLLFVFAIVVGIAIVGFMSLKPNHKVAEEITKPSDNNTFQQITYVSVNWNKSISDDSESDVIAQRKEIIDSCKNLYLYDSVQDQINAKLVEQGYGKLSINDNVSVVCNTSNIFGIIVYSQSKVERVEALARIASDIIISEGQSEFDLGECKITSQSNVYLATKNGDNYVRTNVRAQKWLDDENSNKVVSPKNSIFNKNNAAIIVICLVGAFAIIVLISICDPTITDLKEIENLYAVKYLGTYQNDPYVGSLIAYKCRNLGIKVVHLISMGREHIDADLNSLSAEAKSDNLAVTIDQSISDAYNTILNCNGKTGIILIIKSNVDKREDVNSIIEFAQKADMPVMGYVWIE